MNTKLFEKDIYLDKKFLISAFGIVGHFIITALAVLTICGHKNRK
jgi:hypothetical protein